jgi:hypothetical protein
MPHYKDGSEAKVGDRCRFKTTQQKRDGSGFADTMREAVIFRIIPGASSCNALVAFPHIESDGEEGNRSHVVKMTTSYVTLGECEYAGP